MARREHAAWLWRRTRQSFSHALAACLLPDHLHVITPALSAKAAVSRLGAVLSGYSRHVGGGNLWAPIPPPAVHPNDKHLLRDIRYVHLNPCRDFLCKDPLAWFFSTHRGVIGAEIDPWVSAERLGAWFGYPAEHVPSWLHAYVSGDPTVAVAGTPLPVPAQPSAIARVPLADVAAAVRAATPWSSISLKRRVFVTLARTVGWRVTNENARAIGVHPQTIRRLARDPVGPSELAPALLCLGDPRLRVL
ncbi:MAG: hypothetical protein H6717_34950 [Polyangiaceae bacterium]|nr:hypothetical protein [Polyangiaceae bacterium]